MKGFDRIASAPLLLLPPLALDLMLWLGPRLKVGSLVSRISEAIAIPPNATPALNEQFSLLQAGLLELGNRFNLLTALSSLPVGVPSLMSGRMPAETPYGTPFSIQVPDPLLVAAIWLLLTVIGLGFGAFYHRWMLSRAAGAEAVGNGWRTWLRLVALAAAAYLALTIGIFASIFAASLASALLSILGVMVLFLAFTLFFWLAIYLFFTPHGIVRYGLGLRQALIESVVLVRMNLTGAMGFLGLAFIVNWLTSQVWLLPEEASWFSLLALLGHAFVSAMLWLGSYVFYQGRREWLTAHGGGMTLRRASPEPPEIS